VISGYDGGLYRIDATTGAFSEVLAKTDGQIGRFVVDGMKLYGSPDGSIVEVDLL
jgi:hypothetical protein